MDTVAQVALRPLQALVTVDVQLPAVPQSRLDLERAIQVLAEVDKVCDRASAAKGGFVQRSSLQRSNEVTGHMMPRDELAIVACLFYPAGGVIAGLFGSLAMGPTVMGTLVGLGAAAGAAIPAAVAGIRTAAKAQRDKAAHRFVSDEALRPLEQIAKTPTEAAIVANVALWFRTEATDKKALSPKARDLLLAVEAKGREGDARAQTRGGALADLARIIRGSQTIDPKLVSQVTSVINRMPHDERAELARTAREMLDNASKSRFSYDGMHALADMEQSFAR